jgi:hypothetical protein
MIAGLKIADLCRTAGCADVFGRTRNRNGGDGLVVGLDDDVFVLDFPQHPDLQGGRVVRLAHWWLTALRIAPARISAAGISHPRNNDLAEAGDAGQQEYR